MALRPSARPEHFLPREANGEGGVLGTSEDKRQPSDQPVSCGPPGADGTGMSRGRYLQEISGNRAGRLPGQGLTWE